MRVAIFGGTSYIGRRIVESLIKRGCEIIILHRESSNIKCFNSNSIKYINIDRVSINLEQVDTLVNLACIYEKEGIDINEIYDVNFNKAIDLLKLAIQFSVKEYLYINTGLPKFTNMYSLSKHQFAEVGKFFAERNQIQFTNVLLENYYGPDEPKDRFIPTLIDSMSRGIDIKLTKGTQKRDFIFIDDVINIITKIIFIDNKPNYYVFPLGTGTNIRVSDFVRLIHTELNSNSNLLFGSIPTRFYEPETKADINEIKKLNYELQYDYISGIRKLLRRKE